MSNIVCEPKPTSRDSAGKYLTLNLQRESYAIDVLRVREIIRLTNITVVPQLPAHVCGVINLRGKIIPVINLRVRFGFPEAAATEETCIVVVLVKRAGGNSAQMGLVVDGVEEVVSIAATEIEATPKFGAGISTECILGMAKIKNAVTTLLDIDRVLAGDGLTV